MVDRLMLPIAASGGIRPGELRRQGPAGQL
jgi:hypothetical protein